MSVVEVMLKFRQTLNGVESLSVQSQCSLILGDWSAFRLIFPPDARRDVMQTCTNVRNTRIFMQDTRKHHFTPEALPDIPSTHRYP